MLNQLRQAFETASAETLIAAMAQDVVLRVAVHDQPIEGLPAVSQIVGVVLDDVLRDIEVVGTIGGDEAGVLIVRATVGQHPGRAEALLVARTDGTGSISDLTVFVRPLPALQALAEEMGRRLGGARPTWRPLVAADRGPAFAVDADQKRLLGNERGVTA